MVVIWLSYGNGQVKHCVALCQLAGAGPLGRMWLGRAGFVCKLVIAEPIIRPWLARGGLAWPLVSAGRTGAWLAREGPLVASWCDFVTFCAHIGLWAPLGAPCQRTDIAKASLVVSE